jgi:hypothetical protein
MFADRDFDPETPLRPNAADLAADLELASLLAVLSGGDKFLSAVCRRAILGGLSEPDQIRYRQAVLSDCLADPAMVREIYALAVEALGSERRVFFSMLQKPGPILRRSVDVLELLVPPLRRLREIAVEHGPTVSSAGWCNLFTMLQEELDDELFSEIDHHLRTLRFSGGVAISAQLAKGVKGGRHVLRRPWQHKASWRERLGRAPSNAYSFEIHPRDDAGARALSDLTDRGLNHAANALAQSVDHILGFFRMLCNELAFYVSCVNLHEKLSEKGEPTSMPDPLPADHVALSFRGLYDVCLTLRLDQRAVGNTVDADQRPLVVVTGANSGGKSTFLRSVGVAQLMMQCGMFVGAKSFTASVCPGLYTHFIREEDATMTSGRLDDELKRMSGIADLLQPESLVLFNESFASTNEREGSEIASQIVRALLENRVRVVFVTHQYAFAEGFHTDESLPALFLAAERKADGQRTFRVVPSDPSPTSFGEDLYRRMGGFGPQPPRTEVRRGARA